MTMKIFGKLASAFDHLLTGLSMLTGVLILFMAALVSTNITMRTLLSRSIPGTIELCEWILLLIPFFGAAWLLRKDGHVRMDLFIQMLNAKSKYILNIITSVVVSLVCSFFFWFVALNTWRYYVTGAYRPSVLNFPTYIFSGIMAAGFLFIAIQSLRNTARYAAELNKGKKELPGKAERTNYPESEWK